MHRAPLRFQESDVERATRSAISDCTRNSSVMSSSYVSAQTLLSSFTRIRFGMILSRLRGSEGRSLWMVPSRM
jgi:hypothetical protein